jgi:glycerol-3-phosphate dehydrogenase
LTEPYDLIVIGGGINGCGIARDAAGRGLSVLLCEMNDLGSGTSSWSTKLVHGGLRYLEYYEFRLVREALTEREVLWKLAPHIIQPQRFVLPHHEGLRPAWLLRLGLFLYDHIGGRKLLPATKTLNLNTDITGQPLKVGMFKKGFEYSDCRVDDVRLVIANAQDAAAHGAIIKPLTRVVKAERSGPLWHVAHECTVSGIRQTSMARVLINAAGPWVGDVLAQKIGINASARVRLVQGAHIVVRKLFEHDRAYIFQNGDGRIIFAIPYEDDFTLIGTTDKDVDGDPASVSASPEEIDYLCRAAGEYFTKAITRDDIVWTFAGVRPLYDDGASDAKSATRDYVFEMNEVEHAAPLLSIFGGKITTYRRLAEAALTKLQPYLPNTATPAWTDTKHLPGGDFEPRALTQLEHRIAATAPFLTPAHACRLARTYGTRAFDILRGATNASELGQDFGASLSEREVRYLIKHEWAQTADDIIWRRTKLGLRLSKPEVDRLSLWLTETALTAVTA